jgi:predicted nuclease with TOPRIM domain
MMAGGNSELKEMQKGLRKAFSDVKEEMNMHLDTINQNTSEIQSVYEYLNELDAKLEKLNERIDELQMLLAPEDEEKFSVELTHREQEVFLILYAENGSISAKDVGRRLGFTDEMVNRYAYSLISKGIPILRHYRDGEMLFSLDLKFRDLQARKNVLKIDESVSKQLLSDRAI